MINVLEKKCPSKFRREPNKEGSSMPAETSNSSQKKVVLITGASSGFGLAACRVFLQKGWKVYAALRGGVKRRDLFEGMPLEIIDLDLCDREQIKSTVSLFANLRLDALINNAGYGVFGAAEDVSEEDLRRQMEVNFVGTFLLTQGLLPNLRQHKGAVITVSSVVGRHALPLTSAYCASKFAVEGWMESMAMELAPFGVDCYLIEPGTYPTSFGSGIKWAKSSATYESAIAGYDNLRRKVYDDAKNRKVENIGKKMFQLADSRPRSLRHPMGPDAHATMIAARIVPPNMMHRVATLFLNYLQRRDTKAL